MATSPAQVSRSTALGVMERLGAATHLVSSLEQLQSPDEMAKGGFNNWDVNRAPYLRRWPRLAWAMDAMADPRTSQALHSMRIAAALALIVPTPPRVRAAANGVLTLTSAALYPRHQMGTDGSDQVAFLVQAAATVARMAGKDPRVADAALWFVGLQSTLSYAASGWVKLTSSTWRSGRALPGIMRTRTYGHPGLFRALERYPRVGRMAGSGVLALECLFPLVYAAKGRLAPALVGSAAAFHLVNGHFMGLGRFIPSFLSMHPAVLYTSGPRQRINASGEMERRDDLMPAIVGAGAAAVLVAGLTLGHRRRRQVRAGRPDEQRFSAGSGNELGYRLMQRTGPAADPVIVLEAGLLSPAEHWEWIAIALGNRHTVLTYSRAGYGSSVYKGSRPYRLSESVDDLVELVDHVVGERRVVLTGHSLGGYLALLAGQRLAARVAGYALVDSSHPAALQRSARQAKGASQIGASMYLVPESLRLGLGPLMDRPPWVDTLPQPVRVLALAQYRDPDTWATARREWSEVARDLEDLDRGLPAVTAPALVITAGLTEVRDPVHGQLHDELAAASPRGERHTIADAEHDDVLMRPEYASQVAALIDRFMDTLGAADPAPARTDRRQTRPSRQDTP